MSDELTPEEDALMERCYLYMDAMIVPEAEDQRNNLFDSILVHSLIRAEYELAHYNSTLYPTLLDVVDLKRLKVFPGITALEQEIFVAKVVKILEHKKDSNVPRVLP